MTIARARIKARHLLMDVGLVEPAVDVRAVARSLGLPVIRADLNDDISGVLVTRTGHSAIFVRRSDGRKRARFTIAHEIGHYVLRHQEERGESVFVDRQYRLGTRLADRSSRYDPIEAEANQFAA